MVGNSLKQRGFILIYVILLSALISLGAIRAALVIRKADEALRSEIQAATLKDAATDGMTLAVELLSYGTSVSTLNDPWARVGDRSLSFQLPGSVATVQDNSISGASDTGRTFQMNSATISLNIVDEDAKLHLPSAKPEEIEALTTHFKRSGLYGELMRLSVVSMGRNGNKPLIIEDMANLDDYRSIAERAPELLDCVTLCGDGLVNINTCSIMVLCTLPEIRASKKAESLTASIVRERPFRELSEIAMLLGEMSAERKKALLSRIKLKSECFRVESLAAGADRIFKVCKVVKAPDPKNSDAGITTLASWETWR